MRAMSLRGVRMPWSESGPRWAWALLLALLLPLAQGVAASHAVTHHGTPAQQRDAAPSALDAHCTLCLIAAPVGAGALPSTAPTTAAPAAAHVAPRPRRVRTRERASARLPQPRAAPSLLH